MIGANFAERVGIDGDGPPALAALRAIPAKTVGLNRETVATPKFPTYTGGPLIDDDIVVGLAGVMLRRGKAVRVPILIGGITQDLAAIFPLSPDDPLSYFGADAEKARTL
jgi:para-nitrobenzyl esterase